MSLWQDVRLAVRLLVKDSIIAITMTDSRGRFINVSRLDFLDWRDAARSFSHFVAQTPASLNVSEQGRPAEQYLGSYNSAALFDLIGQRPQIGRDFTAADDAPAARRAIRLDPVSALRYE